MIVMRFLMSLLAGIWWYRRGKGSAVTDLPADDFANLLIRQG
jgi:hypothetical protein